jgi:tRNA threonylcarbamoyladenosine biosynthesis protein TsaE
MEPYTITLQGQAIALLHFDLYRMGDPHEFIEAGFRDQLDGNAICIIEWPEQAANLLPPPDLDLTLTVTGHSREVELLAKSEQGTACLHQLQFNPPH